MFDQMDSCPKVTTRWVILVAVLSLSTVEARIVSSWDPGHIVDNAEILVVGEVFEVVEHERIPKEANRWNIPLRHMSTKIHSKRVFLLSEGAVVPDGEGIRLSYHEIDWENCTGVTNGPEFPTFFLGDVFVFPLRRTTGQTKDTWELIDDEDFGLLVPAVVEPPPLGSEIKTGIAFLRSELAGAFTRGEYSTVFKAAKYLSHLNDWNTQFEETYKRITQHVADDQARWLSIAVACYSAMGVPRPKIGDLLKSEEQPRLQAVLAAKALDHIDADSLDDRFIALSMEHCDLHGWGTAVTIAVNYSRHPTAIRLLKKALDDASPEAVFVARLIIKGKDHPLSGVAVDAAVRVLEEPDTPDFSGFRAACELIRDYGDEEAFALLLADIRESQKTDRERYRKLWQSCAYVKSQRMIPICQIVIDDRTAFSEDLRFCDVAAFELQRVTGEDFGLSSKQAATEREKAIQRAREYFSQW